MIIFKAINKFRLLTNVNAKYYMKKYILAIDAGTTSSRAVLFDKKGTQVAISQFEFTQIFPKESWIKAIF